jgi:hypothetical protein
MGSKKLFTGRKCNRVYFGGYFIEHYSLLVMGGTGDFS